ncbi:MAG: SCP2 sterol-binding domain-containing protein [Gammaproteobacteria bacterium]|nr:SCP2 sterol-binding domain-containing protein [Gammaproteobacteria bacterium]
MLPEFNAAFTAVLETAANQYLKLSPDSLAKLAKLQGKVIAVELHGLNQTLYLLPDHRGLMIQSHFEGEPDATLAGTPISFAKLSLSHNPNRVLFRGDVTISGDIKLGQDFKRILDELDVDWEEVLSTYTGDVIAHKLGELVRNFNQWGQNTLQTLGQNGAEYLQQESFDVPFKEEVDSFITEVNDVRNYVERLAARLARLQQYIEKAD